MSLAPQVLELLDVVIGIDAQINGDTAQAFVGGFSQTELMIQFQNPIGLDI